MGFTVTYDSNGKAIIKKVETVTIPFGDTEKLKKILEAMDNENIWYILYILPWIIKNNQGISCKNNSWWLKQH